MTLGSSQFVVTTPTNHGLAVGTTVRLNGLSPSPRTNNLNINGSNLVILAVTAANQFTLNTSSVNGRVATGATGNYGGNAASLSGGDDHLHDHAELLLLRLHASPSSPPSTCASDASYTKVGVDTQSAAQKQNFANWYSFYRTRMNMMKSASGRAFAGVDDKFRVGFTTINETGTGASRWLGNATFDAAQKSSWYSKLYGTSISRHPVHAAARRAVQGGPLLCRHAS